MKRVVILYGPPGSGKGTQANLLARRFDAVHFDTGKFLESVVYDPRRQKQASIRFERKNFETGKLMTPSFVYREVAKEAKRLGKAGWGIIFSGSPRTMFEAEKLYPVLEDLYGKKNIFVFRLFLAPAQSIKRNSSRLMCKICGAGLLAAYHPSKAPKCCPVCAGPLYRRTLDTPDVIKIRLKQYRDRTLPILDYLKKRKYRVTEINAHPAPFKVFEKLVRILK